MTYADLTTGPAGATLTVEERLAEILVRYPQGHAVHEAITRATPSLRAVSERVHARLARA